MSAAAQTTNQANHNGATSAHRKAHREMLANVKSSKMDRSVVNDIIKNDIAKRERQTDTSASLIVTAGKGRTPSTVQALQAMYTNNLDTQSHRHHAYNIPMV